MWKFFDNISKSVRLKTSSFFENTNNDAKTSQKEFTYKEIGIDGKVDFEYSADVQDIAYKIDEHKYTAAVKPSDSKVPNHVSDILETNEENLIFHSATKSPGVKTVDNTRIIQPMYSYIKDDDSNKIQNVMGAQFSEKTNLIFKDSSQYEKNNGMLSLFSEMGVIRNNLTMMDVAKPSALKLSSDNLGLNVELLEKPNTTVNLINVNEITNDNLKNNIIEAQKLSKIAIEKKTEIILPEQVADNIIKRLPEKAVVKDITFGEKVKVEFELLDNNSNPF